MNAVLELEVNSFRNLVGHFVLLSYIRGEVVP